MVPRPTPTATFTPTPTHTPTATPTYTPTAIPTVTPPLSDGNGDGVPDDQQPHVETVVSTTGHALSLVASEGITLTHVQAISPTVTPPSNVALPQGLLAFELAGLSPGSGITLTLVVHDGPVATGYWKYGPTPDDPTDHWYEFGYDAATGMGAEILGRTIRLHLVDGGRGDGDLTVNGVIADPGGPGGVVLDEFLYLPMIQR